MRTEQNNQNLDHCVEQLLSPRFTPSSEEIKLSKPKHSARRIWLNTLRIGSVAAALVIGLFIIIEPNSTVKANAKVKVEIENMDKVPSTEPDVLPSFQGGDITKYAYWVNTQVKYPEVAVAEKISGRVIVEFFVETDGAVTFSQVLRSPNKILSDEVERVIKSSPKWTPATKDGKAVIVKYAIPVVFIIQG